MGHSAVSVAGRPGAQVHTGCSPLQERGPGKDLPPRCILSSRLRGWCLEGTGDPVGHWGVGPSLPSSALEAARADSGCRFLLGHRRALSVSRRSGAWLEIVAHGGAPQWVVYGEKGRPHLSWALCFARCLGGPLGIAPQEPVTAHALPHPCVLHPRPRARTHSLPLRNKAPSV